MSYEQRINDVREDIGKLYDLVSQTQQSVVRIETQLATMPKCPDPGACVRVESALIDQNRRLGILETAENKRAGAFVVIGALVGMVATGLTLFVEWIRK